MPEPLKPTQSVGAHFGRGQTRSRSPHPGPGEDRIPRPRASGHVVGIFGDRHVRAAIAKRLVDWIASHDEAVL